MDTLFRLVNHCFDASSSLPHKGKHLKEACAADRRPLYMDEAFPSSSSERPHSATPTPSVDSNADLSFLRDLNIDLAFPANGGGRWASKLLIECARAVAACDGQRAQRLMWALNELASPYGDVDQKIAACFLQGVFARTTSSGVRTLRALADAADRNCSFDATRRTALRFQELSPWSPFGHVAANGVILEAFLESGRQRLHILDLSNTFCTQWPTLLEALATRSADVTPHVSITTVVSPSSSVPKVMKEIGQRMERFARLMGVPFRFNAVHHPSDLSGLDLDRLALGEGDAAALVVNCVNALHGIPPSGRRRDDFLAALSRFRPLTVTVVEEVAELDAAGEEDGEAFVRRVGESLRFFSAYLDSLESSFPRTSNERLALEREAGRAVLDLVACPAAESGERRSVAETWARRLRAAGFEAAAFSDDVADDVRGLLRRYREDWSMREAGSGGAGMFLAWKEQPVVWASAWKP